jgi:hypothetical protein
MICWIARAGPMAGAPFLLYTNDIVAFAPGSIIYFCIDGS